MELDANDPVEAALIKAARLHRVTKTELREKDETLRSIHEESTPDHQVRY